MEDEQLITLLSDLSSLGVQTPMEIAIEKLTYWERCAKQAELKPCGHMELEIKLSDKFMGRKHDFTITLNTINHKVIGVKYKYMRSYQGILQSQIQEIQDIIDDVFEQSDNVIKPGYAAYRTDPIQSYLKNLHFMLLHMIQATFHHEAAQ